MLSTERLGARLRRLRQERKLPLRKVAALLDIDVAILSKMERGERRLTREIVEKLAGLYQQEPEELLVLFLSDKVLYEIGHETLALKALQVAEEQIVYARKPKNNRDVLIQKLKPVLSRFDAVTKAWLFGSYARGEADDDSDIDLLVETTEQSKFGYFDLFELSHQLETATDKKIDLGFYDSVKPGPWKRIKQEMLLIYEK